jgi:anti-sigma regulatory factor (Ser/Thr protein kinase)
MGVTGMQDPLLCLIGDRSQVGEARRRVVDLAMQIGLGEVPREKLALLVNELGTNLVKHAGGGELLVRALPGRPAVEVLALDKGGGMASVEESFRDGHSTSGSAGTGLGAVRRLASFVDVYSSRPGGTAIVAHVTAPDASGLAARRWEVGAVCVPKPGEEVCGDDWAAVETAQGYHLMMADGLGHGLGAAEAVRAAVQCFDRDPTLGPSAQVAAIHQALRGTRGAAVAVVGIDRRTGVAIFAGVGNIAGSIIADHGSRHLASLNGTAGHTLHKITEFSYPWTDEALLLLHTDGLVSRWDLDRYPGLVRRHPSLVAGVLFRDFKRGRDDVTVVAARGRAA